MYAEDIYITAEKMCSEESELLGLLSEAAEAELLGRLKPDVSAESIKPLFITAAAMLACSMYYCSKTDGVKAWSVGNVSVTSDDMGSTLRDRAEMLLAGYLDAGSGFEFMGVKG